MKKQQPDYLKKYIEGDKSDYLPHNSAQELFEWFSDRDLTAIEKRILDTYVGIKKWGVALIAEEEAHIVGSIVPRLRKNARATLVQLLGNANGRRYVRILRMQKALEKPIDKSAIEELFARIISTNVTDVVNVHCYNCRHCWGIDHKYQWRDSQEYSKATAEYEREMEKGNSKRIPEPELDGGIGFVPVKSPNENCPECAGAGEARVVIKDTRRLPEAVRMVIKSIGTDAKGNIKVEFFDRIKAAEELGKILKIYETTSAAVADKNDPKTMTTEDLLKLAFPHLNGSNGTFTTH